MSVGARGNPLLSDESAHEEAGLEWWFVHGRYEGSRSHQRYFMSSLFRQSVSLGEAPSTNGFSLLLSIFDPATQDSERLCQIDADVVGFFLGLGERLRHTNLDSPVVDAYSSEIAVYGPPHPVRLEHLKARLTSNPLQVAWKDFLFDQDEQGFRLSFTEPETRRRCRFQLRPVSPRMDISGLGEPHIESMAYATYPRLELVGTVDGEAVRGTAWFDHQWGSYGWFVARRAGGSVLGWDWFGINLDDGSDWVVLIHRDMRNKEWVARSAVVRKRGEAPRTYHDLTAEPLRYWESRITRIRYPVGWRIVIPELETELAFEPLADDQEIQFFGPIRAIWEGTGTISGAVGGQPLRGRARLELHGYGYIFDTRDYQKRFLDRIDQRIEEFFPRVIDEIQLQEYVGETQGNHDVAAYATALSRPIWDLLVREGKRWRPAFSILMLEALGVPSEPYETLLSVIPELCHTGALIIDDIEDDSKLRRGGPCIHLLHGVDTAINAANTIYFLPYLLLARHPCLDEEQRSKMFQSMISQFTKAHFGQGLDIYWTKKLTAESLTYWMENAFRSRILQMYAYKTGAPVAALAENACIIAKTDLETREACVSFGRAFGIAFQIVDDVLNFSQSSEWKKTRGEDLFEGKPTYVIVRAIEGLNDADATRLKAILCSSELREDSSTLDEAIDLVCSSGALSSCRKEAVALLEREWEAFSQRVAPSEPKMMLRVLCSVLLNTAYDSR